MRANIKYCTLFYEPHGFNSAADSKLRGTVPLLLPESIQFTSQLNLVIYYITFYMLLSSIFLQTFGDFSYIHFVKITRRIYVVDYAPVNERFRCKPLIIQFFAY